MLTWSRGSPTSNIKWPFDPKLILTSMLLFQPATVQHEFGSMKLTEYVVPTCSYRMGTNMMGAAIAVVGKLFVPADHLYIPVDCKLHKNEYCKVVLALFGGVACYLL